MDSQQPPTQPPSPQPHSAKKIALVIVLTVLLTALIAGTAVFVWQQNTASQSQTTLQNQINELKSELADAKKSILIATPTALPVPTATPFLIQPSKYGAEILQTGGIGSRINQITAYDLTEQGYMSPGSDWASVDFNSGGDLMWAQCRTGYTLTSCIDSDNKPVGIDKLLGCGLLLKNQVQNKATLECTKQ